MPRGWPCNLQCKSSANSQIVIQILSLEIMFLSLNGTTLLGLFSLFRGSVLPDFLASLSILIEWLSEHACVGGRGGATVMTEGDCHLHLGATGVVSLSMV